MSETNNHDSHYRKLSVQPIDVMESIIVNGLPQEYHKLALRNFRVAMAAKYILRCGNKDEDSQEIDKAINYLTRANTGEWRK